MSSSGSSRDEVPLPVVPLDAVRVPEEDLLGTKVVLADTVFDKPARRPERSQRLGIVARPRVARRDHEPRRARLVQPQDRLAAQVARRSGHEVTEQPQCVANAVRLVDEQSAHDPRELVQTELEPSRDAEVAAASA